MFFVLASAFAAAMLLDRRRDELGSPIEVDGVPEVTPHGHFGARRDGPPAHAHQGVDLVASPRSHVLAVGDGVIVKADPGLGHTVRKLALDEPSRWRVGLRSISEVVYADLGKPLVEPGDRVRAGDPIALVSDHGFVHFAVKANQRFIDPKLAGFKYRLTRRDA